MYVCVCVCVYVCMSMTNSQCQLMVFSHLNVWKEVLLNNVPHIMHRQHPSYQVFLQVLQSIVPLLSLEGLHWDHRLYVRRQVLQCHRHYHYVLHLSSLHVVHYDLLHFPEPESLELWILFTIVWVQFLLKYWFARICRYQSHIIQGAK